MNYDEERIQKSCVTYFNLKYPKLKGLLCSNLNNSKDKKTGGRNKGLGVVAGRSDLVLYVYGGAYHIEVKTPKGRQSDAQKDWQKLVEENGYGYYIIRSLDEFMKLITEILADKKGWIKQSDQEPTTKDLPFMTYGMKIEAAPNMYFNEYEIWEDSDWFQELTENERLSWVFWRKLDPPKEDA